MSDISHILVVDDDHDFLKVVQKILEVNGYEVTTSVDAMDALDKMNESSFDLVISDANMPLHSGFDLVKTIRTSSKTPAIPIALLTGRRDKKDVQLGLDCGADDYIVKPLDTDLFLSKIQNLIFKKQGSKGEEINFSEKSVKIAASFEAPLEITKLSEQGLTIEGPVALNPNTRLRIKSSLYEEVGIETPYLRVIKCTSDPLQPLKFMSKCTFIGLTERELQKIRSWINTNKSMKNARAV